MQSYTNEAEVIQNYAKEPQSYAKKVYIKKGVAEDQNQYVRYASEISGNDIDFLATLEAENGLWTPDRQSEVYSNGFREDSWGFCQVHRPSHPEIVSDPRFFSDPYWQLDRCWQLYQGGTTFYGYWKRDVSKFELVEY